MILRLISFILRLVFSFIFVLILQMEWEGRSLESRILKAGKKSPMVQSLDEIAEDGVSLIAPVLSSKSIKDLKRNLAEVTKKPESRSFISKFKKWFSFLGSSDDDNKKSKK